MESYKNTSLSLIPMTKAETIMNIATKRGFFFPTAEIYNAKAGFWTYGHLGSSMKKRWENLWRHYFLDLHDNYFEIEGSNILPKEVFESSGHLKNFNDPLTECKKCKFRFRADELIEDELDKKVDGMKESDMDILIKTNKLKCPKCGGELDNVRRFNMMFDVKIGAIGEDIAYLSPETAQNPFISFKREFLALRERLPLGLAVIGKAFRNEISPRQGFFRLREFTQAELQIFFDKDEINKADIEKDYNLIIKFAKDKKEKEVETSKLDIEKFYVYHMIKIQKFYLEILKIPKEKFRFRELDEKERAFYNKIHFDIELDLETLKGWKEVAGLHYRGDHDLKGHQEGSKEKLEVTVNGKKVLPHVLELSFGVDRNIWALLDLFFKEEKERTLFEFPAELAPLDLSVNPLVNKDGIDEEGREVYERLRKSFKVFYDDSGSIGRRYRRADEVGIKANVTIDHQTMEDHTITLRDRDSMKQIRIDLQFMEERIQRFLNGEELEELGELIK